MWIFIYLQDTGWRVIGQFPEAINKLIEGSGHSATCHRVTGLLNISPTTMTPRGIESAIRKGHPASNMHL